MGCDFVQFGKTKSVLNKRAPKVALLFNPPSVLSLEIMEDMNISKKKAIASLKELEEVGLVEKKLKGLGQPSLLYVKKFRIINDEVPYGNR